ncbi:MAG: ATP-binding protein [Armatimonadetes bacterium]|nr:ATP-binding protein [Armatimonadota bacterium]
MRAEAADAMRPAPKVHQSGVNFKHLLDDLVDLYPFAVEEAVLVELIANALDAKARAIRLRLARDETTFEILDDGQGMTRQEFHHYHDFAMSLKRKGFGIGFAGLGAKLGVKTSHEVITETRSREFWGASRWYFRGDRLLWEETSQRTLDGLGTRVTLRLRGRDSNLLDAEWVGETVRRHYLPLFDPFFREIYAEAGIYPDAIQFLVDSAGLSQRIENRPISGADRREVVLYLGKRRRPVGIGYFLLAQDRVDEHLQGIGIATFGKMIRRDWFRKHPSEPERITGLVEVPPLVAALTTNKCDFQRSGAEGQQFYRFYREMQSELGRWLEHIGRLPAKPAVPRDAARLERTLHEILRGMPEFHNLFAGPGGPATAQPSSEAEELLPEAGQAEPVHEAAEETPEETIRLGQGPPTAPGLRGQRHRRGGPKLAWADAGDDRYLAWVDQDTIIINTGHPAYGKAQAGGMKEYHDLLSTAVALLDIRKGVDGLDATALLNRFFATWGRI